VSEPPDPRTQPRKGSPDVELDEASFAARFRSQFQDPVFEPLAAALDSITTAAWDAYRHHRKSPRTRRAGPGFADPNYDIAVDWLAARAAVQAAKARHEDSEGPTRILLISGSARSEHTCPGELSKSYRLIEIAREVLSGEPAVAVELLELHRVAAEYGRHIHPCKACFSTSPALCHWPCSCYPNYSLGQTQDWMNEIYPLWVAAHGILIVTPVNWYQVSSPVKLMMDRLVCADGGNPDPSRTHGKDAAQAKAIELEGWDYPRHLAGRVFSVIVHGDVEGAAGVRRSLADWLRSMDLIPAGTLAEVDRYIGYFKPYATSHIELDADWAMQGEVRNAARALLEAALARRSGRMIGAGETLKPPRQK
jgi:multimeric flavodoxin WrbA